MRNWILFAHILAAFALFAGLSITTVSWHIAGNRPRPSEIALVLRLSRVGALTLSASTVLVLGFGLWLVELGGYSLTDGWIISALILLLVAVSAGTLGGQRPKKARAMAERLAEDNGAVPVELQKLLDDHTSAALNYLAAACMLGIVFLMVFKPG